MVEFSRVDVRINVDLASLSGPLVFLHGQWWCGYGYGCVGLTFGVSILCKFTATLGILQWPFGVDDIMGVSFLEHLILFEQWMGHHLLSVLIGLFLFLPLLRIEIRSGRQFVGLLVRALTELPGGMAGVLPCCVERHFSRVGAMFAWANSRPLESCHFHRLKAVCG